MFNLKMPNQIEMKKTYSALIYGRPGIGKTTLGLSAKNPVLLDFDQGIDRVNPNFWGATLQISDYNEVLDFIDSKEIEQFETIVLDTVGAAVDCMSTFLLEQKPKLKNGGRLSRGGYGELKAVIANLIRSLKAKKKKLIFIAHEKEENDGEDHKIIRPDLGAGTGGKGIVNLMDVIGYMHKEGDKTILSFEPFDDRFIAKNSMSLSDRIEVPNPKMKGKNSFVVDVLDAAFEQKKNDVLDNRLEYEKALNEIDDKISKISDALSCTEAYNFFTKEAKFAKFSVWKLKLMEKSKELNLVFNTQKKEFENAYSNS